MTALFLYVACSHGRRPTGTPDGSVVRTSPGFLRPSVSHNDSFLNTKHELTGTLSTGRVGKTDGGTIRDGFNTPVVGSWWDDAKLSWNSWQDLDRWTAPSGYPSRKAGHIRTSHVSWVLCKLSDVEEGLFEVEDDHGSPCGETGYQGHELFGVDGGSIRGCKDLHGSTSATRCCGVQS